MAHRAIYGVEWFTGTEDILYFVDATASEAERVKRTLKRLEAKGSIENVRVERIVPLSVDEMLGNIRDLHYD